MQNYITLDFTLYMQLILLHYTSHSLMAHSTLDGYLANKKFFFKAGMISGKSVLVCAPAYAAYSKLVLSVIIFN